VHKLALEEEEQIAELGFGVDKLHALRSGRLDVEGVALALGEDLC
jgi:hypothetical protein